MIGSLISLTMLLSIKLKHSFTFAESSIISQVVGFCFFDLIYSNDNDQISLSNRFIMFRLGQSKNIK
ncbi:hypothetical protein AYI68_g1380 [Smittium mucronatum]|uniref:Uncharacterized protein n=1 Tax=Smittium mucronatum TaxID=133383 RepID=A0A1R0H5U2_9FUNG|nr:hypothetical protein AYI68_g1380 [Smittium mucronatum]